MYAVNLYGRELKLQGSPYTMVLYRRVFGANLRDDIAESLKGEVPDMAIWLQIVWAMCATHEDIDHFEKWVKDFPECDFSLADLSALEVIDSAISAELFRGSEAGRITRWFSRRLGRMAQRFSLASSRLRYERNKADADG